MPHYAYGNAHRRVRRALLETTPDGTMCPFADTDPKCPGPMYPGAQLLDLHHSEQWMKAAGLPGDRLSHRACNRRERNRKVPADVAARRQRQAATDLASLPQVPPAPACKHDHPLDRERLYQGCECSQPFQHHVANAMAVKAGQAAEYTNHGAPPCASCGGYPRSQLW
jgi:hypothetical protein